MILSLIKKNKILQSANRFGHASRVGQLAAHVRGQDVRRQIPGEVVPRSGRQDHEIGVFPLKKAAHGMVQEAGVGSMYRVPVFVCQRHPSISILQQDVYAKER